MVLHLNCDTRCFTEPVFGASAGRPGAKPSRPRRPAVQEQEPPEEDPDLKPKEYSFNPLEASRNITAGNFYFKKGNYRAASRRYLEASKWDPTSAEAMLRLGEADEKLHDFTGARDAYEKYVMLSLRRQGNRSRQEEASRACPKAAPPKNDG